MLVLFRFGTCFFFFVLFCLVRVLICFVWSVEQRSREITEGFRSMGEKSRESVLCISL